MALLNIMDIQNLYHKIGMKIEEGGTTYCFNGFR